MKAIKAICAVLALLVGLVLNTAGVAHATVADIFTALDTATIGTNISTALVAFVGFGLLFFAYGVVKKLMNRGK